MMFIHQGPTTFHLAASRKAEALAFLQSYHQRIWLDTQHNGEDLKPFASLEEALFACGWKIPAGESAMDVTQITSTSISYQQEGDALAAIASCVTPGSSMIVIFAQEGQIGFEVEKWLFDGMQMVRIKAALSFTPASSGDPHQMSSPQLLVGLQQGLSLSLQCFLELERNHPDLALALEQQFTQEELVTELLLPREAIGERRAALAMRLLMATITSLVELADTDD